MFPTSILGCFAFVGSLLIYNFLTRKVLRLTVDRDGIQYGKRRFLWADIGALRFGAGQLGCHLMLRRRGMIALNRHLLIDEGSTEMQMESLMQSLQRDVAPRFDHLRFIE